MAEHPAHRVVSPHPFDSRQIPTDRYYLDPLLVARLNDKGRIHELTDRIPRAEPLTPPAFALDQWRERWPMPFVIKITTPSGGGDGVALCHSEADLSQARQRFAGRPVKVQEYLADARANINVQLHVAPDGEIAFIGASQQRVEGAATAATSSTRNGSRPRRWHRSAIRWRAGRRRSAGMGSVDST